MGINILFTNFITTMKQNWRRSVHLYQLMQQFANAQ